MVFTFYFKDVGQRTGSKLDSEGLRDHHYSVVGRKVVYEPTTNGMVTIKVRKFTLLLNC